MQFLLNRWASRDPKFPEVEQWWHQLDPDFENVLTNLDTNTLGLEITTRSTTSKQPSDVNVHFQGLGVQSAATILAALVFSDEGSTILIEEPENHLHPGAQEVLADLINNQVMYHKKQVIITTHSRAFINPYVSDLGLGGSERGAGHVKMDQTRFQLLATKKQDGNAHVTSIDLSKLKTYTDTNKSLKQMLG
jgi:ATPase subunit of ABC transporter with duplicated ATPase domains